MVIALLAILKTGAAYLPIDPNYPTERITYTLTDAQPTLLITTTQTAHQLPNTLGTPQLLIDQAELPQQNTAPTNTHRTHPLTPQHPAYIIYTSGSTGRPKGVIIPHQNVTRLLHNTQHWFHFGPHDTWTLFHSYAFDFSVWEIWGALTTGGRLIVVPYLTTRSPADLLTLLTRENVTVLNQTPSAFYQLTRTDRETGNHGLPTVKTIIFGGEALDLTQLRTWYHHHPDTTPA